MLEVYSSRQNQSVITLTVTGVERFAVKPGEDPVLCWAVSTRASDRIRGFVPYYEAGTDIDSGDPQKAQRQMLPFLGQKIQAVVYAINREDGYFVASRRQAMERLAKRMWDAVEEGDKIQLIVRRATVSRVIGESSGVRVEIPRSEVSHGWVEHTGQVCRPGDELEAKVIRVEPGVKIVASLKALQPDPWQEASKKYQKGGIYTGRVTGVVPFGIFVELEPGVSALCNHLKVGRAEVGDTIAVLITKVDHAERKISGKALQVLSRRQII